MNSFDFKCWQHKQANHIHRPVVPKLCSLSASPVELLKLLMPKSHPKPIKMSGVEAGPQNSSGGSIVQQSSRPTAIGQYIFWVARQSHGELWEVFGQERSRSVQSLQKISPQEEGSISVVWGEKGPWALGAVVGSCQGNHPSQFSQSFPGTGLEMLKLGKSWANQDA